MTTPDHQHAFYGHDDPRWLICACGQYAVRARTDHGQPVIRLIDPPQPVFRPRPAPALRVVEAPAVVEVADVTAGPAADVDVAARREPQPA
ncbi:MAG: hypothetical protein GC157_06500 [Frankiales bacterium]|nr:hypothetical protein [Frankiales bacterium]